MNKQEVNLNEIEFEELFKLDMPREDLLLLILEKHNMNQVKRGKPKKTYEELVEANKVKWKKATLSNDLIFGMFMQDEKVCKIMLKVFLKSKNIKIGDIKRIERQQIIDLGFETKSIRLDIYVKDSDRVYNVEMQVGSTSVLALRLRYYQAMIDLKALPRGEIGYKYLKESYIIFICTDQDPFKEGAVEYPINSYYNLKNINKYGLVDTKANWIVFNVSNYEQIEDNDELKSFFAYLKGNPINDKFTKFIDNNFLKVKINEEMEHDHMFTSLRDMEKLAEGYELGREEGREEGIEIGHIETAINMLSDFDDDAVIAKYSKLPIEEVARIREEHSN